MEVKRLMLDTPVAACKVCRWGQASTDWVLFWHSIDAHHGIAGELEQRDMQLHFYVLYICWAAPCNDDGHRLLVHRQGCCRSSILRVLVMHSI